MAKVVAVKFRHGDKLYYFSAGKHSPQKGQGVIVETAKGNEYAVVEEGEKEVDEKEIVAPLKPIVRIATEKDEEMRKYNSERRCEAMKICKQKIRDHKLDMKLVDCEFSFDGSRVVFSFSADGRVDFRELVKDLASTFRTRIELRQIGARDETHLLGGIAPCGREVCCAGCMSEFRRVSIKMAKNQGLSLNPGKVSGLCGRLMCCLSYENDYYAEAYKKTPKLGSSVTTPEGKGTVVTVNMLKMEVRVKIEKDGGNFVYRDFPVDKLSFRRGAEKEEDKDNSDEE